MAEVNLQNSHPLAAKQIIQIMYSSTNTDTDISKTNKYPCIKYSINYTIARKSQSMYNACACVCVR